VGSQRQDGAAAQDQSAAAELYSRRRLPQVRAQRQKPELPFRPAHPRYRLRRRAAVRAVHPARRPGIGVDPSASNIAAAKLHADKAQLSIDYRCTTAEQMDVRERFDIVLAMEVVSTSATSGCFSIAARRCSSPAG